MLGLHHGGIIKEKMLCRVQHWSLLRPPQPLHKRGQHGGGRPLRKRLTLIYCIFIVCLVHAHSPLQQAPIIYSCLLTCFDVGTGSLLTTLVEGLDVCWLHLLWVWRQLLLNNTSKVYIDSHFEAHIHGEHASVRLKKKLWVLTLQCTEGKSSRCTDG